MVHSKITALAIVGLVLVAVAVGAVVYYQLRIRGGGTIKVVGLTAFSDPGATLEVSAVDWGMISPGGISQITLYLKSTSNVPGNLTLETENWEPARAAQYMTLEWDYDGTIMLPGEIRGVLFTLRVSDQITNVTEFSFDMVLIIGG